MRIVQANFTFDRALKDPEALLDRYTTLTGWSEALLAAGAGAAAVVQRFHRNARTTRNGIDYVSANARSDPRWLHWNRTWRT